MPDEMRRITQLMSDDQDAMTNPDGAVQFIDESPPPPEAGGGLFKPFIALVALAVVVIGGWMMMRGDASGPWHHDLAKGMAEAEKTGRPVLVLFTADWCPSTLR